MLKRILRIWIFSFARSNCLLYIYLDIEEGGGGGGGGGGGIYN